VRPAPRGSRRGAGADVLSATLSAVAQGLLVSDPTISSDAGSPGIAPPPVDLTPRELEVLLLLAEGFPNKGVAARLSVSEHTVKFHVNSLMGKLNAQSRTEPVTRATRLGLLPPKGHCPPPYSEGIRFPNCFLRGKRPPTLPCQGGGSSHSSMVPTNRMGNAVPVLPCCFT